MMIEMELVLLAQVRNLRKNGLTYPEINLRLEKDIPKSTLSGWCKDIKLSRNQTTRIRANNLEKLAANRLKALNANKLKREKYLKSLYIKYSYLSDHFENHIDSSLVALSLLYLTEGGKQSGKLMFGNSDPKIIGLFLKLLRKNFQIDETKFRCTVQCRSDQNQDELEQFWENVTSINKNLFYKTRIDSRSIGKKTIKKNYKGVCRIDYFSGNIYNELQVIASLVI